MEASKCPKCGDEPLFIEHLSKWYCYGCNSYVDDEKHECAAEEHVHEGNGLHIEEDVKALEHEETAPECKNCGAKLQDLKDGRQFCFVCETYQDEEPVAQKPVAAEPAKIEIKVEDAKKPEPTSIEPQKLIDETVKPGKFVGEPEETTLVESVPAAEPAKPEPAPKFQVEDTAPKAPEVKIRTCSSCHQPLKFIDKYSRYYCYACKKYAPREDPARAVVQPSADKSPKACPDCGKPMKYIEKYTEWYCYECKKYPLRERAKAAALAKSSDHALKCQTCGQQLKYVPQYSRYYCYRCKKYAPKDSVKKPVVADEPKQEIKNCPACHESMKYVSEYNEWYCYKCKKYALRPVKPVLL